MNDPRKFSSIFYMNFFCKIHRTQKSLQIIKKKMNEQFNNDLFVNQLIPKYNMLMTMIFGVMSYFFYLFSYKTKVELDKKLEGINKHIIYLSNHICPLDYFFSNDILIASKVNDKAVVILASDHLGKGLMGFILKRISASFIPRNGMNQKQLKILAATLKMFQQHNLPVLFYPEGWYSSSGSVIPLKRGLLKILLEDLNESLIVPIKLQFTRSINDESLCSVREKKTWSTLKGEKQITWKKIKRMFANKGEFHFTACNPISFSEMRINEDNILDKLIFNIKKTLEESAKEDMLMVETIESLKYLTKNNSLPTKTMYPNVYKMFNLKEVNKEKASDLLLNSLAQYIYVTLSEDEKKFYQMVFLQNNNKREIQKCYNERIHEIDDPFKQQVFNYLLNSTVL